MLFLLQSSLNKKAKLEPFLSLFQMANNKKTITHTIVLHSSFIERAKLEEFFPLFQMARNPNKKKNNHMHTHKI